MKTHSFERIFLVNTLAHSRDVTMLLNEISLRFGPIELNEIKYASFVTAYAALRSWD